MDDTNGIVRGELIPMANGALRDPVTGRIVKAPTVPPINKDNAAELVRKRHAATRAKLANALVIQSRERGRLVTGPADAVADAGGLLWHDTVLNPAASDRERRETWLALGKHAGMLVDKRETDTETPNNGAIPANETLTAAIYAALVRMKQDMDAR
jgi:hypothetical protein